MCLNFNEIVIIYLLILSYSETEIEREIEKLRGRLLQEGFQAAMIDPSSWDSHQVAAATEKKNEKFRAAFGISSEYVGGSAFDDTLKALKAEEAAAKKEEEENKYVSFPTSASHFQFPYFMLLLLIESRRSFYYSRQRANERERRAAVTRGAISMG